ncbi:hypothetical protein ACJ72_06448 [Emergomyces africanus]|uniref:Zn(2)-C6 fungal-type domain-containing protein n=1 Tax=Emergomyces africanus TaxID=1955775 RepID=A0A1B7NRD7_9EURO|nr:hypothetical protein ACJ72_06448 [Emergomyces africanus]
MGRDGSRRIRSACDRCHLQKLRCERKQGGESCSRCARTDTPCIYSVRQRRTVLRPPRVRSRKPKVRNDESDAENEDGRGGLSGQVEDASGSAVVEDSATPLDWTSNDSIVSYSDIRPGTTNPAPFDLAFGDWPDTRQLPQEISVEECDDFWLANLDSNLVESMLPPQNLTLMPPPRSSDQILTDSGQDIRGSVEDQPNMTVQHVRKLADLNVKLCEHASKLPSVSAKLCDIQVSLANRAFEIDDTFCLIQSLIDVINAIYSRKILPSEKQPSIQRNSTTPRALNNHAPDRATFLLILSCYDRVMDIYQCLFTHIKCCIKHFSTPMTPEAQSTQLPELRIGSYKPPIESAVAMKMFLFHTMARQLCAQLETVLGAPESNTTRSAEEEGEEMGWVERGRGDVLNNDSNRAETRRFMDDSYPSGGGIPVAATPPDFVDKSRHDILTRACAISEEVTSIGKLLMDMSIKP